ncbi:MAG: DUF3179 domain-containing (seleno)protein [Candidatus Hinthialibacter antarcticus]|nr:DUF3179 domain-containing (seleno)protein [Candidatus Hinthialibacter antarcticus]
MPNYKQISDTKKNKSESAFISAGWLLVIAFVLVSAIVIAQTVYLVHSRNQNIVGDGRNVDSYRFDLSTCLVPKDQIVAGGAIKDRVPTLTAPSLMTTQEVEEYNDEERGKYLVSGDIVFGVEINGEARAYPMRVLVWHEIANDFVGGVPIAVAYNYLTDSGVVYNRNVGDETLNFGFSGLLYNSNSLFYDKRGSQEEESLWSQLLGKAVTGPAAAAGKTLEVIPCQRVQWSVWKAMHPETKVLGFDPLLIKRYQSNPGGPYFGSDSLYFPVEPLPQNSKWAKKTPVTIVSIGDERRVYPLPVIDEKTKPGSEWSDTINGVEVKFTFHPSPDSVIVEADDPTLKIRHAAWFAWYSMFPDDVVVQ